MEAYISGQIGKAIIPHGNILHVLDVEDHSPKEFDASRIGVFLRTANDFFKGDFASEGAIIKRLHLEHKKDRALILLLMIFDSDEDEEFGREAAEILDEYLEDKDVAFFLKSRLFSSPVYEKGCFKTAFHFSQGFENATQLVDCISQNQPFVEVVTNAWSELSDHLFNERAEKSLLESKLVDLGFFYRAAIALDPNSLEKMDIVKFDVVSKREILSVSTNARSAVTTWLNKITPEKSGRDYGALMAKATKEEQAKESANHNKKIDGHEANVNVQKQIEGVKEALRANKLTQARNFTDNLINEQVRREEHYLAAKSLCNIASFATDVYQKSFSLELNRRAVEIAPDDGWAWAALADSYMSVRDFENALKVMDKAKSKGEEFYSDCSAIRMRQLLHKYEEAIEGYTELLDTYQHHGEAWRILLGIADSSRDLAKYEDAETWYEKAVTQFPNLVKTNCSIADFYFEIGQFDQAHSFYKEGLKAHDTDVSAYEGIIKVYKEQLKYEEAKKACKRAMQKYPDEIQPYRQLASIYRLKGNYTKAFKLYDKMKERFAYDYSPYIEKAYAFAEQKKSNKAKEGFKEASDHHRVDIGFRIKQANCFKIMEDYKAALETYSGICKDYPNNPRALLGQANLLKELGEIDAAIKVYKSIDDSKATPSISISLAAIYINQKQYEEAKKLLAEIEPQTKLQWVSYHLRGMILIKENKLDDAHQYFKHGIANCPFGSQKKYLQNALAVISLRKHKYEDALRDISEINEPISNVVRLHAYCGMRDMKKARSAYNELKNVKQPSIISLRDTLAARLKLNKGVSKRGNYWTHEEECNALSIAMSSVERKAA